MSNAASRPRRNPWIALTCATAVIVMSIAVAVSGASGAVVRAAAASPSVSHVVITPKQPTKGKGFKVSFKTKAGGDYVVFYSTSANGGPLQMGKTKTGTITTKRVGKQLSAGKYSLGVRVTVGTKQKTVRKSLVIKK